MYDEASTPRRPIIKNQVPVGVALFGLPYLALADTLAWGTGGDS